MQLPILFSDDFEIKDCQVMLIDAKSFTEHTQRFFGEYPLDREGTICTFESKRFVVKKFQRDSMLNIFDSSNNKSKIRFSEEVYIPVLEDDETVWMSHTPMEVLTCKEGIDMAQGNVLMGGLGLGYMAKRILEKEETTHLTIYEKDVDLISFFGKKLLEQYPNKLTLIHDTIYSALNSFDTVVIDIYKQFGDVKHDEELLKTFPDFFKNKEKYWAWGDSDTDSLHEGFDKMYAMKKLGVNSEEFDELINISRINTLRLLSQEGDDNGKV